MRNNVKTIDCLVERKVITAARRCQLLLKILKKLFKSIELDKVKEIRYVPDQNVYLFENTYYCHPHTEKQMRHIFSGPGVRDKWYDIVDGK